MRRLIRVRATKIGTTTDTDAVTVNIRAYQAGVFVSRSSGTVVRANLLALWIMPVLQVGVTEKQHAK